MAKIIVNWDQFEQRAVAISRRISQVDKAFDIVIGIGRGGLPLATCLGSILRIRDAGAIFARKTINDAEFSKKVDRAEINAIGVPEEIVGMRVLLADDIVRTGDTVDQVAREIYSRGVESIFLGTLFCEKRQYPFKFFAPSTVEAEDWVTFPWDNIDVTVRRHEN